MTIVIDGAAILARIANEPQAFAMTPNQVNDIATSAVLTKLKEKDLSLADLRRVASLLGSRDFRILIGNLSDREAKSLAKLDVQHPAYKHADEHWYRSQIIKLAVGEADPTVAPNPRRPARAAAGPESPNGRKIGEIMGSQAQAAGTEQKKRSDSKRSKSAKP